MLPQGPRLRRSPLCAPTARGSGDPPSVLPQPESRETPPPRPPAGPEAQDTEQETWLWPWCG